MSDVEADRFIKKARRALKSYRGELRWSPAPDDIQAAMGVIVYQLRRVAESNPDRRDEVGAIIGEHRPS